MTSMDLTGAQITAILNEGFNGSTNEGPATGSTQNANNKVLQVSGLNYTWDFSDASLVGAPAVVSVTVDHDGNDLTPMVAIVPTRPTASRPTTSWPTAATGSPRSSRAPTA